MMIIDANNAIVGRLASRVAKNLLKGEEVHVVNAEKAVISGNPKYYDEKIGVRRRLQNKQDPEKSPKWPRVPHLMLRRMIRGMLPRKKATGRTAIKRLKVHIGNPLQKDATKLDGTAPSNNIKKYTTLGRICNNLGWRA
jgi:large subunit ribosomal protein L13